jgi:anti-anti-sigma factor
MPFIGDPRTDFAVTTPHAARVSVVAVRGELAIGTVAELHPPFEAAVRAERPLVVDLLEVSFMDSQGLYALLVVRERLAGLACRMTVGCDPSSTVAMVFRVSGTHDLFDVHASRRAASTAARRPYLR